MTDKRDRYQIDATKETRSRINAIKAQLSLKTQNAVLVMLLDLFDKAKVMEGDPFGIEEKKKANTIKETDDGRAGVSNGD